MTTHRKQSKRRRKKKDKNKLRHKNVLPILQDKDDILNETSEPRTNRDATSCSDCKIRKRKGRKGQWRSRGLSPSILRKVLEKVADDTLSGARAGDGSISSILAEAGGTGRPEVDVAESGWLGGRSDDRKSSTGWSYEQHWVDIAHGETVHVVDDTELHIGKSLVSAKLLFSLSLKFRYYNWLLLNGIMYLPFN